MGISIGIGSVDLLVLFRYGKALCGPFQVVCFAKDSNLT